MSVSCNSTRGYIPHMDILYAWTYSTRAWLYSTRGTTRDVYVARYYETWSTQTRNGIHWVPRVITRVEK